jgi:hypothetical protein
MNRINYKFKSGFIKFVVIRIICIGLRIKKKCKKNHTQNDLNQNKEEGTVIDYHMGQGKAIRPFPFRKFSSEGDPDGKEKEDEDSQIGMET